MNDLELCALTLELNKEVKMLSDLIRDSKLDTAFLVARTIEKQAALVMERLNRIKWPPRESP